MLISLIKRTFSGEANYMKKQYSIRIKLDKFVKFAFAPQGWGQHLYHITIIWEARR